VCQYNNAFYPWPSIPHDITGAIIHAVAFDSFHRVAQTKLKTFNGSRYCFQNCFQGEWSGRGLAPPQIMVIK